VTTLLVFDDATQITLYWCALARLFDRALYSWSSAGPGMWNAVGCIKKMRVSCLVLEWTTPVCLLRRARH